MHASPLPPRDSPRPVNKLFAARALRDFGDSFVAMLVSSKMGELDRDVYYGVTTVEADEIDMEAMDAQFAKADAAD